MRNAPIGLLALLIAAGWGGCSKGLSKEEIRRLVRDEVQEQLRERKRRQAPRPRTLTPTSTPADTTVRPHRPPVNDSGQRRMERLRRRIQTLAALVGRFEKSPGVTKARVAMMKKQLARMRERLASAEDGQSPTTPPATTSPPHNDQTHNDQTHNDQTRNDQTRKDWLDALAAGIRPLGTMRWEIDRRILTSILKDPGFANKDAFLLPHRVDGKSRAFLLKYVRPKGFYFALGLKTGDVVERVNNTPLTGPKDVNAFYAGLSKTRLATLVLRRGGRRLVHVYTIKGSSK